MSKLRILMRIESLTTAAAMIDELDGGGLTVDDTGLTEREYEIFLAENKKLAKRLNRQASKLYQSLLELGYNPAEEERHG